MDWSAHEKNLIDKYKEQSEKSSHRLLSMGMLGFQPLELLNRKSIHFLAALPEKRTVDAKLRNNMSTHSICFEVRSAALPSWLSIVPMQGLITPNGFVTLTFVTDIEQASMRYTDEEQWGGLQYSKKELPLLGPYISTESYYRKGSKMEVCHILVIGVEARNNRISRDGLFDVESHERCSASDESPLAQQLSAAPPALTMSDLLIPVVCSLDNPNDFDQV